MSWKNSLESKVKQEKMLSQLVHVEDYLNYIHRFFDSYFSFEEDGDLVKLERTEDKVEFEIMDVILSVKKENNINIKIHRILASDSKELLGQIQLNTKMFIYSGGVKSKVFGDEVLEYVLEQTFKKLVDKPLKAVNKPSYL